MHPLRALRGAGLALLWACASPGLPDSEIVSSPIAIQFRTETEARLRAEALATSPPEESFPGVAVGGHKVGLHAHLGTLGRFLSDAWGVEGPARREGRLALLDPRTRELSFVAGARRGAVPLCWSRDRARLLFSQPDPSGENPQVFEWKRSSGEIRPVTRGPGWHPQACYAGAGRIVVTRVEASPDGPRAGVWMSGPGGRGPFQALGPGPADHSPTCHPGGDGVVFAREGPGGRSALWRSDRSGEPQNLGPGAQPRYGADGAWLVYSSLRGLKPRLFRIRPDGRSRGALGRGGLAESWPALSPDGAHVVYVAAEEPPRRHLYIRRFDGSGDRILFADGDAEFPVW